MLLIAGCWAVVRKGYVSVRVILTMKGPVELQSPNGHDRSRAGVKLNSPSARPKLAGLRSTSVSARNVAEPIDLPRIEYGFQCLATNRKHGIEHRADRALVPRLYTKSDNSSCQREIPEMPVRLNRLLHARHRCAYEARKPRVKELETTLTAAELKRHFP